MLASYSYPACVQVFILTIALIVDISLSRSDAIRWFVVNVSDVLLLKNNTTHIYLILKSLVSSGGRGQVSQKYPLFPMDSERSRSDEFSSHERTLRLLAQSSPDTDLAVWLDAWSWMKTEFGQVAVLLQVYHSNLRVIDQVQCSGEIITFMECLVLMTVSSWPIVNISTYTSVHVVGLNV